MLKFSNKSSLEIVDVGMDFRALISATDTISNPVFGVELISGADIAPTGLLEGTTAIVGSVAYARLHAGNPGVTYKIRCEVDTGTGQHFLAEAQMAVTE